MLERNVFIWDCLKGSSIKDVRPPPHHGRPDRIKRENLRNAKKKRFGPKYIAIQGGGVGKKSGQKNVFWSKKFCFLPKKAFLDVRLMADPPAPPSEVVHFPLSTERLWWMVPNSESSWMIKIKWKEDQRDTTLMNLQVALSKNQPTLILMIVFYSEANEKIKLQTIIMIIVIIKYWLCVTGIGPSLQSWLRQLEMLGLQTLSCTCNVYTLLSILIHLFFHKFEEIPMSLTFLEW